MTLEETFEAVLRSPDQGVPTHLGFNMEVTVHLVIAKRDPSDENIASARAALKKQIDR